MVWSNIKVFTGAENLFVRSKSIFAFLVRFFLILAIFVTNMARQFKLIDQV